MVDCITRTVARLLFVALIGLASPAALGQIDQLPPPDKTSYSESERQQIVRYIGTRLDALGGDKPIDRERARRELLTPLGRPGVSVAFRRAFREAALDRLTALAEGTDEAVVINALLVLGEIGDDPSRQVVQRYTDDERLAVRYGAVSAMARTFAAIDLASPAIDPTRASEMVRHLGTRLQAEPDDSVADAITRAMLRAASLRRDGFGPAARRALLGVGAGAGGRLRSAEGERQIALMSAVRVAEHFAGRLAAAGEVPQDVARAGAAFAGEVLGHLAHRANSGTMPEARGWEADLVTLSERILVFAHSKLGGRLTPPGFPAMLESGDARSFYDRVRTLVLTLGGNPCNLDEESMRRIREALEGR